MKLILTGFCLILSVHLSSQSKKQIIAIQNVTIQNKDVQIQKQKAEIEALLKSNKSVNSELDVLKHEKRVLESKNRQADLLLKKTLKMIPALTIPAGFPESYVPEYKDLFLFNEAFNIGQRPYPDITIRSNSSIENSYNKGEKPSNGGVLLIGILDSTLQKNLQGDLDCLVAILYQGQIRFAKYSRLRSKALDKSISDWEENRLSRMYGESIAKKISSGRPWIGMTSDALYEMFGNYDDLDSYETSLGKIYSYTYRSSYQTYVITVQNSKVTDILKI
jgi:hypothetical protein